MMAQYTTELRSICQSLAGNVEDNNPETVIIKAAPLLFDFYFPFYDENKRLSFEQKFIRHFYMREIAHETFGIWKLALRDWLSIEMPYYNKLYETVELQYQPFDEVNYTKSGTTNYSGNTINNNVNDRSENNSTNSTSILNDTPQNNINSIENGYMTSLTKNNINERNTAHNEENGTSKIINNGQTNESVRGKVSSKSYAQMVEEYRSAIINVDKMVLDAMNVLFMQIY